MNKSVAEEYIKDLLFYLLNDTSIIDRDKELIKIIKYLNSSIKLSKSAIYLFNHWKQVYQPVESASLKSQKLTNDYKIEMFIKNALNEPDAKNISYQESYECTIVTIPLTPTNKPNGLIIFKKEGNFKNVSRELLNNLQLAVEKILNILNYYQKVYEKSKRDNFLFEMTSHLSSLKSKEEILKYTIESMHRIFPDFSHYLLLSHDHNLGETLPIKTMRYNDDIFKGKSYDAFISGNLHLDLNDECTTINAPLVGRQGIYGVLQIVTPTKITFMEEDKYFVTKFGNSVGRALENITLYISSQERALELKIINETAHQLNSNLQENQIIKLIKMKIMSTCQASQVGFIIIDEENDSGFKALSDSSPYFYKKEGKQLWSYLLKKIMEDKDPIILGSHPREITTEFNSIMTIPMYNSGEIQGSVIILHEDKNFFTLNHLKLMQSFVQHLTLALKNFYLRDKLEKTVITDYLTNLSTRGFLEQKIRYYMKNDTLGVLILFDIDNFKEINDRYGHYVGDKVIIQVANLIKENVREGDITSRWGGEELAVYLPKTSRSDGLELAKRICRLVEQNTKPRVTLSAGVSDWTYEKNITATSLFLHADYAMYEAKSSGKNQAIMKK